MQHIFRYYHHEKKTIMILDCLVVLIAIAFAYFIRIQFSIVLFKYSDAIILFPWLIFLRIFTNLFFEHYSVSIKMFGNQDMIDLLKHCSVPSVILLILRFYSPFEEVRMPITMIVMEYCFSVFGFIAVRLYINKALQKRPLGKIGYRQRLLFYGEVREIKSAVNLDEFNTENHCEVVGILTSNTLHWQNEIDNIRVYGDESKLKDIIMSDDSIAAICLINPEEISHKRKSYIMNHAKKYMLNVYTIKNRKLSLIESRNQ